MAKTIQKGDLDSTAHYKSRIENAQRAMRKKEQEQKREWNCVFFSTVSSNDPNEEIFQKLVKMITSPSMGPNCWDGVGADKTAGVWRFDEAKANKAKKPFHEEGVAALGEKEDGASADISRVTTAEDVSEGDPSKSYPTPVQSKH